MSKKQSLAISIKKEDDISKWYIEIIQKAKLADYTKVSGCIVYRPNSYEIWEKIKSFFDEMIKKDGVKNCYFPTLIPKSLLEKEKNHIDGFSAEVAWIDYGGNTKLGERLAIRPTSETIIYDSYSSWIRSYRDLPLRLNQWCNVVRWEFKHSTPFLRGREFLWQEGHTAFENKEEAINEVFKILSFYKKVSEELLAIPVEVGRKSISEKFAGAEISTTIESLMPDCKIIQNGTSHYLGQNFSKAFDIKYEKENAFHFAYQNSWGISTRLIGAMILIHSDNKGLVLPPKIAENKVVIIPLLFKGKEKNVLKKSKEIFELLKKFNLNPILDDDKNISAGFKFNKYEICGTPLRIEIGPRDLENNEIILADRITDKKIILKIKNLNKKYFDDLLNKNQKKLFDKAKNFLDENTIYCENLKEFEKNVKNKKRILVPWFENEKSEKEIKEKFGVKTSCIPIYFNKKYFDNFNLPKEFKKFKNLNLEEKKCFFNSKKKANCFVYFCRSY